MHATERRASPPLGCATDRIARLGSSDTIEEGFSSAPRARRIVDVPRCITPSSSTDRLALYLKATEMAHLIAGHVFSSSAHPISPAWQALRNIFLHAAQLGSESRLRGNRGHNRARNVSSCENSFDTRASMSACENSEPERWLRPRTLRPRSTRNRITAASPTDSQSASYGSEN
jgi:hypothetical protein